jgi:hypothetical protein
MRIRQHTSLVHGLGGGGEASAGTSVCVVEPRERERGKKSGAESGGERRATGARVFARNRGADRALRA